MEQSLKWNEYLHRHPVQVRRSRYQPRKGLKGCGIVENGISEGWPILRTDHVKEEDEIFDFVLIGLVGRSGHGAECNVGLTT